jgi:predicted glycosyltransferase
MLPPVTKTPQGEYRSLDRSLGISLVRRARSAVLLDVVSRWKPDVMLVDHAPHGMKGELLPVFDHIKRTRSATLLALGLRDILDEPSRVIDTWTADGVYATIEDVYDSVMVYGERDMFDLAERYGLSREIADRIEYCGYVTTPMPDAVDLPDEVSDGRPFVLAMIGGGGDGVEVLIDTALAAAAAGTACIMCTGPLMADADRQRLADATGHLKDVFSVEHLPEPAALAAKAAAVVSRGGYNSLCELIAIAAPTIVVPRSAPRLEQLIRARAFAERGLLEVVEDSSELGVALPRLMADAPKANGAPRLDLGGAQRTVAHLQRLVGGMLPRALARIPA